MSDWIDVARQDEFPPGEWRSLDVDGAPVAVFNLNGEYHAIEDVCTHDGGALTGGALDGEQSALFDQDRRGAGAARLRAGRDLSGAHRRRHGAGARHALGLIVRGND